MGRKNVLKSEISINQSLAASYNSAATVVQYLDNISYQINVRTTNSQGTYTVQGSNDYQVYSPTGEVMNTGNWVDLQLTGIPAVNAANVSIMINLNQVPFYAIRIAYTSSVAGTGHADIYINAKQIGG